MPMRPTRTALWLAVALLAALSLPATAVTFVDSGASLLGAAGSSIRCANAWGDYDNDGDLDLLVAGSSDGSSAGSRTRLYRNTGGSFAATPTTLPNLGNCALSWGDFDRDGDLDLALLGIDSATVRMTRIYRNQGGGTFTDIAAGLTSLGAGGLAWGDYDADGDLDLAYCGSTTASAGGATVKFARNDAGVFVDASTGLTAIGHLGAVAFGDVDGDGDLDLVVSGFNTSSTPTTTLFRNDAGAWVSATSGLPGLGFGVSLAFGDVDGDGDQDLGVLGTTTAATSTGVVRIYANNGSGSFTDLGATLAGASGGSVNWGDFDADGDLDLLVGGNATTGAPTTYVARNGGAGVFTQVVLGVTEVGQAAVAWGDYDDDGRLDIALAGVDVASNRIAKIYRNTDASLNAAPAAPGAPTWSITSGASPGPDSTFLVQFTWTVPGDDHTPASTISYELRIGTTPGGSEIIGGAASAASGFRRVVRAGGHGVSETRTLRLQPGRYYWSVQAVDGGLRGSAFTAEQAITLVRFTAFSGLEPAEAVNVRGAVAVGDADGDGDLDILLTKSSFTPGNSQTFYYRNVGTGFTVVPLGLPGLGFGSLAWGDYDHDGDLDLAMLGRNTSGVPITRVYRNDGADVFVDIAAPLTGLTQGDLAWGDIDNDGDLDLVTSGTTNGAPSGSTTRYYRNDAGSFVDASTGLEACGDGGRLALGDLDGDGDLDLLVNGGTPSGALACKAYKNFGGTWSAYTSNLPAVDESTLGLADIDSDGDLDAAVTGTSNGLSSGAITGIYTNNGTGVFSAVAASLSGLFHGSASWGDYDSDGDPDLVYSGLNASGARSFVALNTGSSFTQLAVHGAASTGAASTAWADFDGDGDLELVLAGNPISSVYRTTGAPLNASPAVPAGLTATDVTSPDPSADTTSVVQFAWMAPTDDRTPSNGLSYELRVGTTPGGSEITGAWANGANGYRRTPRFGGTGGRERWALRLAPGTYYWSVQAVDAGLRGSAFAAEKSFTLIRYVRTAAVAAAPAGLSKSALALGDQDGDGDLDLVVSNHNVSPNTGTTDFYRNDGGVLVSLPSGLGAFGRAAMAWGDYDRDGDLDLAVQGELNTVGPTTHIYRNDGPGVFTDIGAGLEGALDGSIAWGDVDQDGDLDFVEAGSKPSPISYVLKFYRNDAGTFVDASTGLEAGGANAGLALGDLDRDGDLDLVVIGSVPSNTPTARIYRYESSTWVLVPTAIAPHYGMTSIALGDHDADGDLDLAVAGSTGSGASVKIYSNDGTGAFSLVPTLLDGMFWGSLAWGDQDGDGDLDLVVSGHNDSYGAINYLARNEGGGVFTETALYGVPLDAAASTAWADMDQDGRLDVVTAGFRFPGIYRAFGTPLNTPPTAPTGLGAYRSGDHKVLRWNTSTDAQTPAGGLSYDVRIGASTRGGQIVSLPADSVSGLRKLAQRGVAQADSFVIDLPEGVYYFTVQSIDASFAGSALPAWQTVPGGTVGVEDAPVAAPLAFALRGVSPNPVGHAARVTFDLPREADVDLSVYDVSGRQVATLLKARFAAGRQAAMWEGRGDDGSRLPAGVYLMRLRSDGRSDTRRVVLSR